MTDRDVLTDGDLDRMSLDASEPSDAPRSRERIWCWYCRASLAQWRTGEDKPSCDSCWTWVQAARARDRHPATRDRVPLAIVEDHEAYVDAHLDDEDDVR